MVPLVRIVVMHLRVPCTFGVGYEVVRAVQVKGVASFVLVVVVRRQVSCPRSYGGREGFADSGRVIVPSVGEGIVLSCMVGTARS